MCVDANAVKLGGISEELNVRFGLVSYLGVTGSFGQFVADLSSFDDSGAGALTPGRVGVGGDFMKSFTVGFGVIIRGGNPRR